MKAFVITHSSSFESRAEAVGTWLARQGAEVTWIYSDFDHIRKKALVRKEADHVYLHLQPYAKNLSVERLLHIRAFAKEVGRYLAGREADLLYVLLPANSLAGVAEEVKTATGARVVLDIVDLWPESLPLDRLKALPPARLWARERDRHLGCADHIFTECRLYQQLLDLPPARTQTLYWCNEEEKTPRIAARRTPMQEVLEIAYVGSINYLIDREAIGRLLQALSRQCPTRVHVIGEGETKEAFLQTIRDAGAEVIDHGAVYDPQQKAEIFSACALGLNCMVEQVKVGLTMKSLDYLASGLPLLNNIPGDLWDLVEEYDAGVNVPRGEEASAVPAILAIAKDARSGEDAARLYREKFTYECFTATLEEGLRPLLAEEGLAAETAADAPEAPKTPMPENAVVMAVKDGEAYLREQLDSILPQLGENDEVVISVDPSEDATFPLVCEYAAKDARIRICEGPGQGLIKNVEHALRQSRGRRIFLADQDDIWLPGKVEKVGKLLESATLVLHDARMVDAAGAEIAPSFMQWRKSRTGLAENLLKNSYIGCCMAFRRELLEVALPFPEDIPMHDQWLGLMAEKHGQVRLLRTPLILYRRHEGTATKDHPANPAQMLRWRLSLAKELRTH